MLISSWLLSGGILLVHTALCIDQQDDTRINKTPKQIQGKTEEYKYNHPPLPESTEQTGYRKEKSININNPRNSTRPRVIRRRKTQRTSTVSPIEIPVEVIYETEPTTKQTTSSPVKSTTRDFVVRRRVSPISNKKIDIRQTPINKNTDDANVTGSKQLSTSTVNNDVSSTTEIPKRSRQSFFKKRIGPPAPKVKIVEEKNFVYAHSGNFHYR